MSDYTIVLYMLVCCYGGGPRNRQSWLQEDYVIGVMGHFVSALFQAVFIDGAMIFNTGWNVCRNKTRTALPIHPGTSYLSRNVCLSYWWSLLIVAGVTGCIVMRTGPNDESVWAALHAHLPRHRKSKQDVKTTAVQTCEKISRKETRQLYFTSKRQPESFHDREDQYERTTNQITDVN